MNKWKIAFFISLSTTLLTILGTGYIVLTNTILSGHNSDNLLIITEDIENISKAIQNKANTIDEFDKELNKANSGHWTDRKNNIIKLQIVAIKFDTNGNFNMIETNQRSSSLGKFDEDKLKFDKQLWTINWDKYETGENERHYMLNDLIKNHLIIGMDSVEVKQLLGEPERDFGFSYNLGLYRSGFDPTFLILDFDTKGKLKNIEIQTI